MEVEEEYQGPLGEGWLYLIPERGPKHHLWMGYGRVDREAVVVGMWRERLDDQGAREVPCDKTEWPASDVMQCGLCFRFFKAKHVHYVENSNIPIDTRLARMIERACDELGDDDGRDHLYAHFMCDDCGDPYRELISDLKACRKLISDIVGECQNVQEEDRRRREDKRRLAYRPSRHVHETSGGQDHTNRSKGTGSRG